jgi:uncharacterized NAD-dependent epimerase/dehydratase family protein
VVLCELSSEEVLAATPVEDVTLVSAEAVTDVVSVELVEAIVEEAETDEGAQQERVEVVETQGSVPVYAAQQGTSYLTGARPPPQSSGSQTSPFVGSYQWTVLSAQLV